MEQLDIDALKKYAGVYETELIFHLTLINKSLFDIHCLSHCVHLVTLDISGNNIESVSSLSNLKQLKRLNASHNRISKVHDLCNMPQLEYINLENNNISSFVQVSHLSSTRHFPSLLHVSFRSLDKAFSNPICDDSAYTKKIMEICARREDKHQIVSIDHCRIASIEVRQSIDQMLAEYRRESKQKLNSEGERETISSWIQSCDVLDGKFNPLNTVIRNDLKFQTEKKKLLAIIQSSKNELSKLNIAFKNCTERK
eukprot:438582_1